MNKTKNILLPLDKLSVNKSAYISSVKATGTLRRRLYDLGFIPGATITPLYHSPLGDPVAYKITESIIALRRTTASQIIIKTGASIYE